MGLGASRSILSGASFAEAEGAGRATLPATGIGFGAGSIGIESTLMTRLRLASGVGGAPAGTTTMVPAAGACESAARALATEGGRDRPLTPQAIPTVINRPAAISNGHRARMNVGRGALRCEAETAARDLLEIRGSDGAPSLRIVGGGSEFEIGASAKLPSQTPLSSLQASRAEVKRSSGSRQHARANHASKPFESDRSLKGPAWGVNRSRV